MLLRLASTVNFTFHLSFRRWEANESVRLMRLRERLYFSHEDLLGHASGGQQCWSRDLGHPVHGPWAVFIREADIRN